MTAGSTAPEEAARPAVDTDLAFIVELAGELRLHTSTQRGGPLWASHDALGPPSVESLSRRLDDPRLATFVGTLDDHVLAYGLAHLEHLEDTGPLGVIDELFVSLPARAVALGETILAGLVAWCTHQDCAAIDATALPGDRAAKNFFESAGFKARSLTMHKSLTP